jgi:hypothetical protein
MLYVDIIPWTNDNFSHSIGFGGSLLAVGTAPLDESAGGRCRVIFVERQGQVRDTAPSKNEPSDDRVEVTALTALFLVQPHRASDLIRIGFQRRK